MVLAICATYYHLFNILQLKRTLLKEREVDLVLTATSSFAGYKDRLVQSGLFRKVEFSSIGNVTFSVEINEIRDPAKRSRQFMEHLEKGTGLDFDADYTDLYIPLDDWLNKLIYYCLVQNGMGPAIHLYDEGTASYTLDFAERLKNEVFPHERFGKHALRENISELLLYAPELCSVKHPFPVNKLPGIDLQSEDIESIRAYFNAIFPYRSLPLRRFIYFESGSYLDYQPGLDIEILDQIAQITGKEDIAVRLHPRATMNRFSRRGYHVMPEDNMPWEIVTLNEELDKRIFVSNISTAALTAHTVFGINIPTINLFRMDPVERSLYTRQKSFSESYKLQEKVLNEHTKCFFAPKNIREAKEIIRYLEKEKYKK